MSVGVASFRNAFVRRPDKLISFSLRESMSILIPFRTKVLPRRLTKEPCSFARHTRFPSYLPSGAKLRMTNKCTSQSVAPKWKTHRPVYIYITVFCVYISNNRKIHSHQSHQYHFLRSNWSLSCRSCIITRTHGTIIHAYIDIPSQIIKLLLSVFRPSS